MRKVLLILVAIIGFGTTANAQDVILKQDGSEINVKVIEITDQQVKYKDFDYQSGPIRNINISEVFRISYENGQIEVFNKRNDPNFQPSKRQNITNCTKKNAFGLDIGIGGNSKYEMFAPSLGIRVMHHFNPYFGMDIFKVNWITDVFDLGSFNLWTMRLQFMSGFRGNSPAFLRCMSVYTAFRLGSGMQVVSGAYVPNIGTQTANDTDFKGLCFEAEFGINFTPTVFAGFAYNYHKHFGFNVEEHTFAFRLGFNFGNNGGGGRVSNMGHGANGLIKRTFHTVLV